MTRKPAGLFTLSTLIVWGATTGTAQQPPVVIEGRLTVAEAGGAVSNALVSIEGTALVVRSDDQGRYRLTGAPAGPQILRVAAIGFAPIRHVLQVPTTGTVMLDLKLAKRALSLPGLVVTSDPVSRARGELGTASVIGQEAIRNQSAATLAGLLELVPGSTLQPPGLDNVQQFGLRAVAISPGIASGPTSSTSAELLASFGTQIVLDGVPLSNNANLQTLGPGGEIQSFASSAGGGIDLRRIPAATLERVEVIRGIPSVRYGDLTQGVIVVETRAGSVDPEIRLRADARTLEGSLVGGRSLGGKHLGTASTNIARTTIRLGSRDDQASRLTFGLSHRYAGARFELDTRADGFQLIEESPFTPLFPKSQSRSRDAGLRITSRARWSLGFGRMELTAALEGVRQRSFSEAPRVRGAMPFTNRLTEGRQVGKYIGGEYIARVDIEGDPRHLYLRAETDFAASDAPRPHRLRAGLELRREWNDGPGYIFDVEFPPQVEFNGVQGFARPRRFDLLPAIATSAAYVDDRITAQLWSAQFQAQAGVRADVFHTGGSWASGVRDLVIQPRLMLQLAPTPTLRLRAGAGRSAKLPTLGSLYPAPQYHDVINVNWYANNPAERLAVLTTRILDPTNSELGYAIADKLEAGFELDLGSAGGQLAAVAYSDRVGNVPGIRPEFGFLIRDRFQLTDSTLGTGVPPGIIEPPFAQDTIPVLLDRPANHLTLRSSGAELTAFLPELAPLHTRLAVQGAWTRTRLAHQGIELARAFSEFQLNELRNRAPYWLATTRSGERLLVTTRIIHHQPVVGLVITGTLQYTLMEKRRDLGSSDSLSFAGYVTRAGDLVPVPVAERTAPQYADLRVSRTGLLTDGQSTPADWLFSLQVSKTLPLDGMLSFYAFNSFDRIGMYPERDNGARLYPGARFGVEATFPLGLRWGER
jgi:outer membrane receptor protein involved in Fe transport